MSEKHTHQGHWTSNPGARGNQRYTGKPVEHLPILGDSGCWCGQPQGHDWPSKAEGAPHPRNTHEGIDAVSTEVAEPKPTSETMEKELWTPEDAVKALATNHVNRKIRASRVTMYSRAMQDGHWDVCDVPIAFNSKGELINGQHRLNAQIAANVPLYWWVMRNAPEDLQAKMDSGAARKLSDILTFGGMADSGGLAATLKLCHGLATGRIYMGNRMAMVTPVTEWLDFFDDHPEIVHSNKVGRDTAKTGTAPVAPSALGAAHWWITEHVGADEADAFLNRIGSLVGERQGSPVIALVKRFNELNRLRQRTESRWLVYMIVKAWNYDARSLSRDRINLTTKSGAYKLLVPLQPGTTGDLPEDEDE